MTARSPIERILRYGEQRGWRNLKLYSDTSGEYTRDYVSAEDADMPAYNVFTRRDGLIRLFWSSKAAQRQQTPARIHTTRQTCHRSGRSSTQHQRAAGTRLVISSVLVSIRSNDRTPTTALAVRRNKCAQGPTSSKISHGDV